ncbi:hypothetical protein [Streptomyces cinereoruber]|uniref:hypothetical protein n=1 Tax=Streptomyces cinereoruber TaxID=67260 RepID=UPI0036319487
MTRLSPGAALVVAVFVIVAAVLTTRDIPPFNAVAIVFGAGIAAAVTLRIASGSPTALLRPVVTALQTASPA